MTAPTTTATSLFRREALDHHAARFGADALFAPPPSIAVLSWFATASVAALIAVALTCTYPRTERANGYLELTNGSARVLATKPGTITVVHVQEGDTVHTGEPLVTVGVDSTDESGKNVDLELLASLQAERNAQLGQIERQAAWGESEGRRLQLLVESLTAELTQLAAQTRVQERRVVVADQQVTTITEVVEKGFISKSEQNRRVEAWLAQKQALEAIRQQAQNKRGQLLETESQLEQLPITNASKIRDLRRTLSDIEQRIAEIEARKGYIVRAPIDGRVFALQTTVGRPIESSKPLLSIVPSASVLQAQLFVPSRAIAFIETGQEVHLMYDAFPYQKFGTQHGHVVSIARAAILPSEVAGPVQLQEPSFRVTVSIDQQEVNAYGREIPLQPDSRLTADVILERRTLMEWFLDPLLSVRR